MESEGEVRNEEENRRCSNLSDSDIDEVLVESISLLGGRIPVENGFFESGEGGERDDNSSLPTRKQIVGATKEYVEMLKSLPDQISELVPEFLLEDLLKPNAIFWNYPKSVRDYSSFEDKMVPIVGNGGIKKLICRQGRDEPLKLGNNVCINYYVYSEGSDYCVDSNMINKLKPHNFILGRKRGGLPVIDLGTLSMKVKEVAAFLAEPKYAYGSLGVGKYIPENSRVLCLIEVLSKLSSPSDSCSIINMVPAERKLLRFIEVFGFVKDLRVEGHKNLEKGKIARALKKYLQAVTYLEDATPKNSKEEKLKLKMLHTLYSSASSTSLKNSKLEAAAHLAEKALELPLPEEERGYDYFRYAVALYLQKKYEDAKPVVDKAFRLLPDKHDVISLRANIYSAAVEDELKGAKKIRKKSSSCVSFFRRLSK